MRKRPDAPDTTRLDLETRLADAEMRLTYQVFRLMAYEPGTPEARKAMALLKIFEATYFEMLKVRDNLRVSTYLTGRSNRPVNVEP